VLELDHFERGAQLADQARDDTGVAQRLRAHVQVPAHKYEHYDGRFQSGITRTSVRMGGYSPKKEMAPERPMPFEDARNPEGFPNPFSRSAVLDSCY
jgi:hypothetical protein